MYMDFLSIDNRSVNMYQAVLSADNELLNKGWRALLIVFALEDGRMRVLADISSSKGGFRCPVYICDPHQ